jgi:NADH/F420H2 dehydrogenase subunit C
MFFSKSYLIYLAILISNGFASNGLRVLIIKNNLYINVHKKDCKLLLNFLKLHSSLQFSALVDLFGIDTLFQKNRFNVVYSLLNHFSNIRIFIKTSCSKLESLNSIVSIFKAANWLERETWDMFGIFFTDHPDLRRILTDYGFRGYPLRKDFPLVGYNQIRYDDIQERLVYEPVSLSQKYRIFFFASPWSLPVKAAFYKLS